MRALSAADLLDVLERGDGTSPLDRTELLLQIADPQGEPAASLPPGARNARLLALHSQQHGDSIELTADCPSCRETLEIQTFASALLGAPSTGLTDAVDIEVGDSVQRFRLPLAADLTAVLAEVGLGDAPLRLARRCWIAAPDRREPDEAALIAVLPALSAAMDRADPLGDIRLDLACAACGHSWLACLDPLQLLWGHLASAAAGLFLQVDALARAYGWREAEVLALSPRRRRRYVELAAG